MTVTLDRVQGANAWLTVGLREGKNREIRRAMAALKLTVNRLIRVSYGPFRLGELQPGEVEEVRPRSCVTSWALPPTNLPAPVPPVPRPGGSAQGRLGARPDTQGRPTGRPRRRDRPGQARPAQGQGAAACRCPARRAEAETCSPARDAHAQRTENPAAARQIRPGPTTNPLARRKSFAYSHVKIWKRCGGSAGGR